MKVDISVNGNTSMNAKSLTEKLEVANAITRTRRTEAEQLLPSTSGLKIGLNGGDEATQNILENDCVIIRDGVRSSYSILSHSVLLF